MRSTACRKARGSARSGVMSLKTIPGLGKSGMSRMYLARSIAGPSIEWRGYKVSPREATMPPSLRRAVPADAPVVVEFNRLLAQESEGKALDPAVLSAGVAAALADPARGLYFLAEQDGQVLGQILITTEWSDWRNGWFWWIQSVYVRPEARRRGVFRALFEHVEQ